MVRSILLACAVVACFQGQAAADLIAYWNFNSYSGSSAISPTFGSGSITIAGFPTSDLLVVPGSTINALGLDPAGNALGLKNNANNGDHITLAFSMSGYSDLVLSYATRRTSTGFNNNQWSYSTDGLVFTPFGSPINPTTLTTFGRVTQDFSTVPGLNMAPNVFLRYTLSGATASLGNNRIDNMQLNAEPVIASVVPEPSSMSLMGLGLWGMAWLVRRGQRRGRPVVA